MKEILRPQAAAGSITPQLEGAAQSVSHPERVSTPINSDSKKGGTEYE